MSRPVPYKYYKMLLLFVWTFAALGIIATWVGFSVPSKGALAFGIIIGVLVTLGIAALTVLLAINGREDYKKRAFLFGALGIVNLVLFILSAAFSKDLQESFQPAYYAIPASHTIMLIAISALGAYFWIRNRFTFRSAAKEDAVAAFGGPVEDEKPSQPEPLVPEEPKPARDEKTGIVSL